MILSHRVQLNAIDLDSVSGAILVQGIEESAGKEQITTANRAEHAGQRVTSRRRDSLDVTVRFSINIKKWEMMRRSSVFEAVCAWAAPGGWLTLNYRPERRLRVVCAQFPAAGDQWNWTNIYTIVFRAYGVPYWQDCVPRHLVSDVSTGSTAREIYVHGSAETVLDAAYRCSGTCSRFSLAAGSSRITLEGLSMHAGQTLALDHTEDGLLRIRVDGASVLDKRAAESSDDLYVLPGRAALTMTADGPGTLAVQCTGRYAG